MIQLLELFGLTAGGIVAVWTACRWPQAFLFLTIFTRVLPTLTLFSVGGLSVAPYMVFEVLAVVGWAFQISTGRSHLVQPPGMWALVLHISFTTVSLLLVQDLRPAFTSYLRLILHWLMVFLLVGMITNRRQFHRLVTILLLQATIVICASVLTSLQNLASPSFASIMSFQFQKNDYATYLAFVITLSLAVLSSKSFTRYNRNLALISVLLSAASWPLTYSRSGFLAIVTSIGVLVALSRSKRLNRILVIGMVATVVIFSLLPEVVRDISTQAVVSIIQHNSVANTSFGETVDTRIELNQVALNAIFNQPILGIGYNQWGLQSPRTVDVWDYKRQEVTTVGANIHNRYLLIAVESGVFALLGYLAFLGILLFRAYKMRKRSESSMNMLLNALIAITCGYMISNLFIPGGLWEWTMLGILAAAISVAKHDVPAVTQCPNHHVIARGLV